MIATKENLINIQKIYEVITKLENQCPKEPSIFNPKEKQINRKKSDPKIIAEIEELIQKVWDLEKIVRGSLNVKKGDEIYYLDSNKNEIKEAVVISLGKYKNDYNDFSDFVRIKNSTHSWYQSKDSIVKK